MAVDYVIRCADYASDFRMCDDVKQKRSASRHGSIHFIFVSCDTVLGPYGLKVVFPCRDPVVMACSNHSLDKRQISFHTNTSRSVTACTLTHTRSANWTGGIKLPFVQSIRNRLSS